MEGGRCWAAMGEGARGEIWMHFAKVGPDSLARQRVIRIPEGKPRGVGLEKNGFGRVVNSATIQTIHGLYRFRFQGIEWVVCWGGLGLAGLPRELGKVLASKVRTTSAALPWTCCCRLL